MATNNTTHAPRKRRLRKRFSAALVGLGTGKEYFLPPRYMTRALEMERSRSDRSGSIFCLVLFDFAADHLEELSGILQKRIRMTDVPGLVSDGRVALLLPETPLEGAEKLADDLCALFPANWDQPEVEILVHPGDQFEDDFPSDDHRTGEPIASLPESDSEQEPAEPVSGGISAAVSVRPMRERLARPMPVWKRSMDIAGALAGITLTAPILLAAAVAIKLSSPGPIFFRQERDGFAGRRFKILKLRTMITDAEKQREELAAHNELDGPAFKIKRDPRITRVGQFLRTTSIDELPQFWNILMGDMSLVGPRPLPTMESLSCERWQKARLHAVPGLTCTWQVSGRSEIAFDDWARMDVKYIKDLSMANDIKLIAKTVPAVLARDGAY